ncbi:MAG: VTT domain-containing protein [Marinoscillum sp.]
MTLIDWLDPRHIIEVGGVVLILLIIFAESGLFFGFFLPGDSLLFTTGLLCGTSLLDFNVYLLVILAFGASVLGYAVGYYTGFKLSESRIFREEQFLFRKSHMTKADYFFKKYGLSAFVIARFIPLVRTYIPILAGATRMDYRLFTRYNLLGAALWVSVLIMIGYFLGKNYPQIIESLGWIVIGLILLTLLPFVQQLKHLRKDVVKP